VRHANRIQFTTATAVEKTRLRQETAWRRDLSDEEQHEDDGQGSDYSGEGFGGHCAHPIAEQ